MQKFKFVQCGHIYKCNQIIYLNTFLIYLLELLNLEDELASSTV